MKRRLARGLALLIVVAALAPFVVYAVPTVVGADHSFVVLSGSMEPRMAPGDVVVVEEVNPATIEPGAIITFTRAEENAPTTHRVVDVHRGERGLTFETKGDANEDPDPERVPAANVVGTVTMTIPQIGRVIRFANTPLGFAALLIGPLGVLGLTEAWSLRRNARSIEAAETTAGAIDSEGAADDEVASESETSAPIDTDATTDLDRASETITIGAGDLTATTVLLALLTPYAVHVAFRLRTALAVTVAFASASALLAVGDLAVAARRATGAAATPDDEPSARKTPADDRAEEDSD